MHAEIPDETCGIGSEHRDSGITWCRCLFVYGCKGDIHWDTRERVKESLVSEVNASCVGGCERM